MHDITILLAIALPHSEINPCWEFESPLHLKHIAQLLRAPFSLAKSLRRNFELLC